MKYNQTAVTAISKLESAIANVSMDCEMRRKVLSVLGCVEYQVEEGPCPAEVLTSLREAINCWLKHLPDSTWQDLQGKVDVCFDRVAATMK